MAAYFRFVRPSPSLTVVFGPTIVPKAGSERRAYIDVSVGSEVAGVFTEACLTWASLVAGAR
eukprot:3220557-Alexandrium_andersonii.AAC.1